MGERLVIAMVTTANGTPTLRILYRAACIQQFLIPPVPTVFHHWFFNGELLWYLEVRKVFVEE